jgi:hypothetical protein
MAHVDEIDGLSEAKAVKSRWNACYALANLFRNPQLPAFLEWKEAAESSAHVFSTLLSVINPLHYDSTPTSMVSAAAKLEVMAVPLKSIATSLTSFMVLQ